MRHHMSIPERAKQFMSFSALKGLEEAVAEKEIIKQERIILGEDAQEELDMKLRTLEAGDRVELCFFCDGAYKEISGRLNKIDRLNRILFIGDKEIAIDDISEIK